MILTEDQVTGMYSITFMMGKGARFVPVLIPQECEAAMEVLANRQHRTDAGISPSNDFLFNYTRMSDDGYNGITEHM